MQNYDYLQRVATETLVRELKHFLESRSAINYANTFQMSELLIRPQCSVLKLSFHFQDLVGVNVFQ